MSKAIEQSIKEKLKTISKKEGLPFNQLLETLFLERFLVRMSKSKYNENFIFKGGMCLDQFLNIGRETRDLDFLLHKLEANNEKVKTIFKEIADLDNNDGFSFGNVDLGLLSIVHKKYPGFRISIVGKLGQVKQKITVDIGVGDVVRPRVIEVELMQSHKPLFEDAIKIGAYPPEYIFSEKLEAIIHLAEVNGRMKDFYDCLSIIREVPIVKDNFKEAIQDTFSNRGTTFSLIPEYGEILGTKWNAFTSRNKIKELDLERVILEINNFLKTLEI